MRSTPRYRSPRGDVVVALDADTQFEADTIAKLLRWFADPAIGAVAGNAKVGNRVNLITRWQALEIYHGTEPRTARVACAGRGDGRAGARSGAWRRAALDSVGGYPDDTLAEDQDLTIAIQRAGWHVACDMEAIAWTEAPETARALFRQRYRWAYGTLQCLWKHRAIIGRGRPRGLALLGLPQALVFQVLFTLAAPLIDVALVGSIATTAWRIADRGVGSGGRRCRLGRALLGCVHRDRSRLRLGRVPAGGQGRTSAAAADAGAAVRLSPVAVRGGPARAGGGDERTARRLGQAGTQRQRDRAGHRDGRDADR